LNGPLPIDKLADAFRKFFRLESSSGILLLLALASAVAWANSPWSGAYFHILDLHIGFPAAGWGTPHTLKHWINDGLMTFFFFVVGLEIKREMVAGELASPKRAAFPAIAALGGMLVPAAIYGAFNLGHEGAKGWGIPMATDIPFALGVLALLGKRVPNPLKVFLMALAIIDDLGAIVVIAVFYSKGVSWAGLGMSAVVFAGLFLMGRAKVGRPLCYFLPGILLWYLLSRSGVHGTIAGVLVAMTVPAGSPEPGSGIADSPLHRMERSLHPWTSYLILPLFALANAGVPIDMTLIQSLWNRTGWGIFLGLVLGKPLGICGACWAARSAGFPALGGGVRWTHLLGAGMLGGIGFTMSIFVSGLAFGEGALLDSAKVAVFLASFVSGALGWVWLRTIPEDRDR
jgi:Na+:H+ antiporter, NhaA family